MENKKENINALDEISKGTHMGMDAINFILDKVSDDDFKKVLDVEYNKYKKIAEEIDDIYKKYNSEDEPHETGAMTKVMTWYGISMKTLTDKSNSKIAELLMQGTNMGIIEGRKVLNNKNLDKEVTELVSKYVEMQEDSIETLKKYL